MRICSDCGIEKTEDEFSIHHGNLRRKQCKTCRSQKQKIYNQENKKERALYAKNYRQAHKKEIAAYLKNYYETHKEQLKTQMKFYYQAHREEAIAYRKNYCDTHKEEVAIQKKHYEETHKEKIAETHKNYYNTHRDELLEQKKDYHKKNRPTLLRKMKCYFQTPAGRIVKRAGHSNRRAKMKNAFIEDIYEQEIFKRDGWRCQICSKKVNPKLKHPHLYSASLDHIVPLAKGGTHEKKNTQLAHLHCNISKGNRAIGCQLRVFG